MGDGVTNGHAEESGGVVFQGEGLVGEGFGAVDAGAAGAVAVEEVATLDHEVFDLWGALVVSGLLGLRREGARNRGCAGGRTTRWNLLPL